MQTITTQEWKNQENHAPIRTHEKALAAAELHAYQQTNLSGKKPRSRIDRIRNVTRFLCQLPFFGWMGVQMIYLLKHGSFGGWVAFFATIMISRLVSKVLARSLSPLIERSLTLTVDRWNRQKAKKALYLTLLFICTVVPVMALFGWFHVLWLRQNPSPVARCVEMISLYITSSLTLGLLLKWLKKKERIYDDTPH